MIHQCNIHCHTIDPTRLDLLNIEDKGKWLPFLFHLDIVIAAKQTSDEQEEMTYNCTTVFTEHGDTYVIDTPYFDFFKEWKGFINPTAETNIDDLNF